MIELVNLKKTFKTRYKEYNEVLKGISVKLPDTGLVFVVGKSGSGKTTLLSLIGGLEETTSGKIIVDNVDITKLSHKKLDQYRNETTGYIFQDYQLIENLTVYENIKMMLDFKNNKDFYKIDEALKEVDLENYGSRYPRELSGGEKQRVAIARVLVKNPDIILADEPTGNLDVETSKQILKLLRKLSKDRLVLTVSHNIFDSNEFADYILYLSDGQINGTYIRNKNSENKLQIDGDTLYIPLHKNIKVEDKKYVLDQLSKTKIKSLIQKNNEFLETSLEFKSEKDLKLNNKLHISAKNNLHYGFKFLHGNILKSLMFSLFSSVILSFIGLCVLISSTDVQHQSENYYRTVKQDNIILEANSDITGGIIGNYLYNGSIPKDYEKTLRECGYTGKVYESIYSYHNQNPILNLNINKYREICSFIDCDEEYLTKIFGKNGKLDFVYTNPIQEENGFYITDYFASIALIQEGKDPFDYESVVDLLTRNTNYLRGIIKSHYDEKYPEVYENFIANYNNNAVEKFKKSSKYKEFKYDLNEFYFNAYGLNQNTFLNYYLNPNVHIIYSNKTVVTLNESNTEMNGNLIRTSYRNWDKTLEEDEIVLGTANYLNVVGGDIPGKIPSGGYLPIEPIEVDLSFYNNADTQLENCLSTQKVKIAGICDSTFGVYVSDKIFDDFIKTYNLIYKLYFEDPTQIESIINFANKMNLDFSGNIILESSTTTRYINTLDDFFIFIMVCLIIVTVILLFYYHARITQNKIFEIGVMKSLGARDRDLILMFSLTAITGLAETLFLYNIFQIILVKITDKILHKSIVTVAEDLHGLTKGLSLIFTDPMFILIANLIIICLFILFYLIPFIKVRLLKPTNIVKAKE